MALTLTLTCQMKIIYDLFAQYCNASGTLSYDETRGGTETRAPPPPKYATARQTRKMTIALKQIA